MDLVKIGFLIKADGLKEANTQVDQLLNKVDNIGAKGKKAATDFESSQKKASESVDKTKKSTESLLASQQKQIEMSRKAIALEQTRSKYISQGYGKTDATRISRMELSGADITTLNNYKQAINETNKAVAALKPTIDSTSQSHSKFTDQVKGIAIYAALSAAIYGVMTSMTNLAVATVKMADEYTAIQNRMKLYIKDANELGQVNTKLAQYAMENNVGLRETATLFTRIAPSMQKLGANTAAITSVVDAFGKSMRIGGATAMEAASATIQFSQAMAAGKLQGDEFRSISEASPRFLRAIAEGSGIAADQLKKMSSEGALTAEVISKALLREYPKLIEENKKLGITLEQGANAIKTGFLVAVGEFNEGAKLTQYLGEAMANLAQDMLKAAQSARSFGVDVNKWFKDNADTINKVIEGFKILASVVAAKYVVSVVAAIGSTAILTWNFVSLSAAIAGMSRTAFIGATALTALGNAAKSVALSTGGLVGLITTLASAALIYTSFKDNAAEANAKLIEQSEIVRMTKEEVLALTAAQKENLKLELTLDIKKLNKNIEDAESRYLTMVDTLTGKTFGNKLPDAANQIIEQVKGGTKSFDDATTALLKMGMISEGSAKQLIDQTKVIVTAKQEALKYSDSAKLLGVNLQLAGNQAHNATPAVKGFKSEVQGVGDEAINTSNKVMAFGKSMQDLTNTYRNLLKLRQATGLNETFGMKALEEGQAQAARHDQTVKTNQAIAKAQEKITDYASKGVDTSKAQAILDKKKEQALAVQNKLALEYAKIVAPQAKQAQDAQEANAAYTNDQKQREKTANKEAKETERIQKANEKIMDKYQSQTATAKRLTSYLLQGVTYSVAKLAAEDKYAKVYGNNLKVAEEIYNAEKDLAELESKSKAREDAVASLKTQIADYKTIASLMQMGYSYAVAQQVVNAGFLASKEGVVFANNKILASLQEQLMVTEDETRYQQDLLDFVKSGLSVEEASAKVAVYRNKYLTQGLITTSAALAEAKKANEVAKSQLALEQESNSYKEQATYLVKTTKNELADIMNQYKGVTLEEAKTLQTRKDIVQKLREYNDLLEKQRTLTFAIESTDFDVFGDFGNPFKSALEGLNSLLFGMSDLETKYQRMGADLTARIDAEVKGSEKQKLLIAEKADLELAHIQESKQARDKAISSGLSLTKSLFKEESKGYKVVSALEQAYQASKIAFALWEKREELKTLALKIAGYAKEGAIFLATTATKIAAQLGFNVAAAQGAVASAAQAPPPVGFASAAAMIALLAGLGIALSGGGSAKGSFAPTNEGTGTVFGDTDAKSESIKKSIDLLADNSDLMLPLTSAMLRSLRNIESNIGGLTNLLIRTGVGKDFNIAEGFSHNAIGKLFGGSFGKLAGGVGGAIGGFLGAGFGSILGLATGGLGFLLGGALSSLLGGLFGTKTSVKGQGLFGANQSLASILDKGFSLQEYVDVNIKKKTAGITTSNKNKTMFSAADQQLANQFTLIFEGFYDSILNASTALGMNVNTVADALEGTVISMGKINLQGLKGEEIQEKLTAVFGAAADKLAQTGVKGLDDFQKVGEGYYETLVRVATGIEQANYFAARLNVTAIKYTDILNKQGDVAAEIVRQSILLVEKTKDIKGGFYDLVNTFDGSAEELTNFIFTLRDLQDQLFMTGKDADYLTSAMILGAGGLDKLSSGLDAYFEMLSPAEQAAELTRRLTNEFAIFGKELPADVKAFRNLVSSIDISSEAGQKLYGQIIALAPEFNDLQDALESANSDVNALVKSLRDLAEQARAARGETEQPRNLAYIRSQFEATSLLAMQGDVDAANRLLDLGKTLMTLSKTYSTTGGEYAKDLAAIQRAATVSADVQEAGLGYTIGSSLTPASGANTVPTVETTNSATDARLDALNEKIEAGLFAIAKYTQDTANRLERWDYGDRMVVRVEQDATDVIKVETI